MGEGRRVGTFFYFFILFLFFAESARGIKNWKNKNIYYQIRRNYGER